MSNREYESKSKRFVGYRKASGSVFVASCDPIWIIFDRVFKRECNHCPDLPTMKRVLTSLNNF